MASLRSRLRSFFAELKRRRVLRALAVYAAVGWGVIEVVETVVPLLFLPEWIPRAVVVAVGLGLPFVLAGAWFFDLTGEGLRPAEDAAAEPGEAPSETSRTPVGLVILTLAVLVGAGWLAWEGRGGAPSPPSEETVAILPFGVTGGSETQLLREGMVRLLSMNLDGAGSLRTVDPAAVLGAVEAGSGVQDPEAAGQVARTLGAGRWVVGELVELGGRIRIRASLYGPESERDPVTAEAEGDTADLFGLVDRLTGALLAEEGGGFASLSSLTTESLPALKAYLAGEEALSRLDLPRAIEHHQTAIRQDSTFALAAYRLGIAASWAGQVQLSRQALRQGRRHAGNLSPRDRLLMSAAEAFILYGDADEAERLCQEVLAQYPQTVEAYFWLGETRIHYGPVHGRPTTLSRESFERMLAGWPDHGASLFHLIALAAQERRLEDLDSLSSRMLVLEPSPEYRLAIGLLRGLLLDSVQVASFGPELQRAGTFPLLVAAANLGQIRHVPGVATVGAELAAPGRGDQVRATGHLMRAYAAVARGRWRTALDALEAAEGQDRATGVLYRGLLALSPLLDPSPSELRAYHADVEALDVTAIPERTAPGFFLLPAELHPALRSYVLGLLEARLGRPGDALHRAEALEAAELPEEAGTLAPDLARSIRSGVARSEGEPARALRLLEKMEHRVGYELLFGEPVGMALERIWRGDLLAGSGRHEEALDWYASASDAWHFQVAFLAPGHLGRARVHDRLGNADEAARHYRAFVELWSDADPDLQEPMQEARARLDELAEGAAPG